MSLCLHVGMSPYPGRSFLAGLRQRRVRIWPAIFANDPLPDQRKENHAEDSVGMKIDVAGETEMCGRSMKRYAYFDPLPTDLWLTIGISHD